MKKFLLTLWLGSESVSKHTPNPFYKKQKQNLEDIWRNKTYNDFGLERLVRITLQFTAIFTPGGVIRHFTTGSSLLFRKTGIEIYGIFKVLFIWQCIHLNLTKHTPLLILTIILTADTLHFLLGRIFLNDVWRQPISYKRSLIMTFLNYIEVCLCFAFIYSHLDYSIVGTGHEAFVINEAIKAPNGLLTSSQAIYFSFVTSATIGYGDISAADTCVMHVVNTQIIISLFFVVVFISNVTSKIEDNTFYNEKNRKKDP